MTQDWQDISSARFVREGTVADLKMQNGRVYRAKWWQAPGYRAIAWYPLPGQARKSLIGLYDPIQWRPLAIGIGDDGRPLHRSNKASAL